MKHFHHLLSVRSVKGVDVVGQKRRLRRWGWGEKVPRLRWCQAYLCFYFEMPGCLCPGVTSHLRTHLSNIMWQHLWTSVHKTHSNIKQKLNLTSSQQNNPSPPSQTILQDHLKYISSIYIFKHTLCSKYTNILLIFITFSLFYYNVLWHYIGPLFNW